jgi:hypothetical protein
MLLKFSDGESFATGAQPYLSRPLGGADPSNRVIVEVEIGGLRTSAVLDTGAPYVIVNPSLAESLGVDPRSALFSANLSVRGHRTAGSLHRLNLTLMADEGEEVTVEATVFIPEVAPAIWSLPLFIGWTGCLERLRFAIDPFDKTFYFGPFPE